MSPVFSQKHIEWREGNEQDSDFAKRLFALDSSGVHSHDDSFLKDP